MTSLSDGSQALVIKVFPMVYLNMAAHNSILVLKDNLRPLHGRNENQHTLYCIYMTKLIHSEFKALVQLTCMMILLKIIRLQCKLVGRS